MQDTPQIKAIIKTIENGKCKNIYAARNKIKKLRQAQLTIEKKQHQQNYLAN